MFRKLTILVCLVSFCPAAAGAQDLALIVNSQPAVEGAAGREEAREVNLTPSMDRLSAVVAANDQQGNQMVEVQRPKRTHTGLTMREFCEVHFGEYRWVYWVGAVAAIVALHVVVAD